jgi:asparagine synthase (glutamine-hydrolysing)
LDRKEGGALMCGIVALSGFKEVNVLSAMSDLLTHRGPDDRGQLVNPDDGVALAMRRLSIIDLEGGHQPMANEDGTIWVVANGEIYNAPDLRPDLEARGHRFATTNSDTEVLLHLYEEKGPDLLEDLNGMYAFVIYDQARQLLFGARDRLGIKPLYYWTGTGRFACASELKALLLLPNVARQVNLQSLYHYLTLLYVPDEASIIQDLCRLPPGHRFVYDLCKQELNIDRYWQPRFGTQENHSEREWAEQLRAGLRQAVSRWTLSDVPIACSLSGGLDSPAIIGLLAELGHPHIRTYTLGFAGTGERAWDETERARLVAQRWGTDHHEFHLEPDELLEDLVSMVWHLDEPYGGGLPSWYVFREMSRDVKVGLTGTGGDELLGSYGKFRIYETNPMLRAALALRRYTQGVGGALAQVSTPFAALANRLPPSWRWIGHGRLLSQLPHMLGEPFGHYYYANSFYLSDADKRTSVLQPTDGSLQNTSSYLQGLYDSQAMSHVRNGLAAVDIRTQLAEEFLFMTDRFSMAHSLEARVPLLDHELVEMVYRIPARMRTRGDDLKYLFKRAVEDLIPPELLDAPKSGFVIPVQLWLRGPLRPLVQSLLDAERLQQQGIFDPQFYARWVLPHLEGRRDHTWQIWAALMFQLWYVVFVEEGCRSAPSFGWRDLVA